MWYGSKTGMTPSSVLQLSSPCQNLTRGSENHRSECLEGSAQPGSWEVSGEMGLTWSGYCGDIKEPPLSEWETTKAHHKRGPSPPGPGCHSINSHTIGGKNSSNKLFQINTATD